MKNFFKFMPIWYRIAFVVMIIFGVSTFVIYTKQVW